MRVVLAYDVVSDRRRGRFFKKLKRYLVPVQKSVFEGELSPPALVAVEALVARELNPLTDSVRIYSLCRGCEGLVHTWGVAIDVRDPDDLVVV